jgi:hypothetical protein
MGRASRRHGRRRLALLAGIATVAVLVGSACSGAAGRNLQARPLTSRSSSALSPSFFVGVVGGVGPGFGEKGSPFAFGRSMSLSDAQTEVGFNIPHPNDDQLASDGQITTVWVDTGSGAAQAQIELEYSSGLSVELEAVGRNQDVTSDAAQLSFFQEQAAEFAAQTNGAASVTSVNGHPALVVPQNSAVWANGQSQGASGDVEFILAGEWIDIVGHFGRDDLQRVASTVSVRPA